MSPAARPGPPDTSPWVARPDGYSVAFEEGRAVIDRRDGEIGTTTEVMVGEDDVELRRVTLRNHGTREATIELTSYAELVLAPAAGDAAHPAFSKLFVRTEWLPDPAMLLATRRVRTPAILRPARRNGWRSKAMPTGPRSSRPTALHSSVAGATCVRPLRSPTASRWLAGPARYWIRCSACAGASACRLVEPRC